MRASRSVLHQFCRNVRAWWLIGYRRANPMCSRCGTRVQGTVSTPPECACYYRWLAQHPEAGR